MGRPGYWRAYTAATQFGISELHRIAVAIGVALAASEVRIGVALAVSEVRVSVILVASEVAFPKSSSVSPNCPVSLHSGLVGPAYER